MTATQEPAHRPLRTVADVIAVCDELGARIRTDERELLERMAQSAPDAYPSRSSGAESAGGATNRTHDFGTEDRPDLELVPQHSDPVGEAVAWEPSKTDHMRSLRDAYAAALVGMRAFEECRSHLARTRRRDEKVEPRDRENCWPCLDVGARSPVYRDSAPNGEGKHQPRCSWHYNFFLVHRRDAPDELTVAHVEGRRIDQGMVDVALGLGRKAKNARRKKGRRR